MDRSRRYQIQHLRPAERRRRWQRWCQLYQTQQVRLVVQQVTDTSTRVQINRKKQFKTTKRRRNSKCMLFFFTSSSQVWLRQPEWSLLQRAVPSHDWWRGGVVHVARLVVLHQIRCHDGTSRWPRASAGDHRPVTGTARPQQSSRRWTSSRPIGWKEVWEQQVSPQWSWNTFLFTSFTRVTGYNKKPSCMMYLNILNKTMVLKSYVIVFLFCVQNKAEHGCLRQFGYIWGFSGQIADTQSDTCFGFSKTGLSVKESQRVFSAACFSGEIMCDPQQRQTNWSISFTLFLFGHKVTLEDGVASLC